MKEISKNNDNQKSSNETSLNLGFPCPCCVKPETPLTQVSLPGIYRIIHPQKKRVFFGETCASVWLEIAFVFDMMEEGSFPDCEFYQDYKESGEARSRNFRCLVLESSFEYKDSVKRQETLNKLRDDFLKKYPSYRLYEVPPF